MYKQSFPVARFVVLIAGIMSAVLPAAAQTALPMEPIHEKGQPVVPSIDGWWQNADGSYSFMLGYYNRNLREEVDVPIGPENHIDPAGDYGQPTHFYPRRHWGVFVLTLPKEVALNPKKPAWTLSVHGRNSVIPVNTDPIYQINPFSEIGIGNTPPTISLDEKGPSVQGPKAITVSRTATVGVPFPITVWAADDAKAPRPQTPAANGAAAKKAGPPPVSGINPAVNGGFPHPVGPVGFTFEKFRGPDVVTFDNSKPVVEKIENGEIPKKDKFNGKATTTATFVAPGEYVIRVDATDSSGEGGSGFLCCWTNIYLKVNVSK